MDTISLHLSPEQRRALYRIACDEDVSIGEIVVKSIEKELYRRTKAKTAFKPDERSVAPLRALLADDFAYATSWHDLQSRLSAKGYRVDEVGGGIAILREDGTKLCKGSDLGCSYSKLVHRFGAPLPGHAHVSIVERVLRP